MEPGLRRFRNGNAHAIALTSAPGVRLPPGGEIEAAHDSKLAQELYRKGGVELVEEPRPLDGGGTITSDQVPKAR